MIHIKNLLHDWQVTYSARARIADNDPDQHLTINGIIAAELRMRIEELATAINRQEETDRSKV